MKSATKTKPFREGLKASTHRQTCVPPSHPVAAALYIAGYNKGDNLPMTEGMDERQLSAFQNFRRH